MKRPLVSIIVPVYNAELTLERCIDSILNQSYQEIECILINDGSSDSSYDLCESYNNQDKRVKVFHQNNQGVSVARNVGLDHANGEYIMFVDCDDEIENDYINTYVSAISNKKDTVVIGGFKKIEGNKCFDYKPQLRGVYGSNIWDSICIDPQLFGYICSKIFPINLIRENNILFRTDMYSQEDLDFCLSVYRYCTSFIFIDNTGYKYYFNGGKRIPPIWNYVENQLKLNHTALEIANVSEEAKQAIESRICLLIYTYLYNQKNRVEFNQAIRKMESVVGLKEYLESITVKDRKSRYTYYYKKGYYSRIFNMIRLRKWIKKAVKK